MPPKGGGIQRLRYRLAEQHDAEEEQRQAGRAKRRKKSQGMQEEDETWPGVCDSSDDEEAEVRKKPAGEIPEDAKEEYRKMIMKKYLTNRVSGWQMKEEVSVSQRAGARGLPQSTTLNSFRFMLES